jgi:UDP-N-acetylglucosamine 2-epimerase (non-hydrolysing)
VKIALIAGARPNFMKIAPLAWAMAKRDDLTPYIIHTGQHYDDSMSRVFFDELEIPRPDINLDVGSGSHAAQTARVMAALEPVLVNASPDWVVVVGDVNSTLAGALVSTKLGIPTAHVEAGLRSGDRTMPEEINRLATDAVCDLLLPPSADAVENLRREGHPEARISLVGNVMVDTLLHLLPSADTNGIRRRLELDGDYILVTLHRPANVDQPEQLMSILSALEQIAATTPVIFPIHPRTRALMDRLPSPATPSSQVRLLDAMPYLNFIALQQGARAVITDSGGIQEETTVMGVPCLTFRDNTERPITITHGTNRLVGTNPNKLADAVADVLADTVRRRSRPEYWDGRAADRILDALHPPSSTRGERL